MESSERIRKQQKDLINLLQRSHSITTASTTNSNGDASSIVTFNSAASSIPHKRDDNDNDSILSLSTYSSSAAAAAGAGGVPDASSQRIAVENTKW